MVNINMPMDGWIVFGDIMYLCHVPSQIAPGDSLRTLRTLDLCLQVRFATLTPSMIFVLLEVGEDFPTCVTLHGFFVNFQHVIFQ